MVNEGSLSILFLGYGGSFLWSGMKRRKEDKTAVILGVLMSILLFTDVYKRQEYITTGRRQNKKNGSKTGISFPLQIITFS